MASYEQQIFAASLIKYLCQWELFRSQRSKRRCPRRFWVKDWLLARNTFSHMGLLTEIWEYNPDDFQNYLRMSEESFAYFLSSVMPFIKRKSTVFRESTSAEQRLAVTLHFLATGRSLQDLRFSAAISTPALSAIIPESCMAIYLALHSEFFKYLTTTEEWKWKTDDFEQRWQFQNCGGALDGKDVRIMKPAQSGSYYYNYKGIFSVILMALVDANYEFVMIDIVKNDRVSDARVLDNSTFMQLLHSGGLG